MGWTSVSGEPQDEDGPCLALGKPVGLLPRAWELHEAVCFVPCWVPRAENGAWRTTGECLLGE